MTTTERILQSSGLESAIGSIQPREFGLTSDTERAVIGTTGGGAKFLRSEDIITVSTAAPAAFGVLRRDKTICFVDTTAAGASVAIDITAGAQVAGYSISFVVVGTAGRNCTVSYGPGLSVIIAYGYSYDFIWTGTAWLPVIVEKLGADIATPRGYIDGLTCSNAADADHDITIAVGKARDSTDALTLILASALTKQIDAAWAAGTNAGGMDTGAVAANTVYYVWIIRKDSDGTIDALFSLSSTAPTMPAGYTYKRLIRCQVTDAAANIIQTDQIGDEVRFKQPIISRARAAIANTNRNAYTTTAPPNVRGIFNINPENTSGTTGYHFWYGSAQRTDTAASVTNCDFPLYPVNDQGWIVDTILTNASRQIYGRGNNVAIYLRIIDLGWIDDRGRVA